MYPAELMRKYNYGYVHSCEILKEPFVRDLLKENQELRAQQKEFIKYLENEINTSYTNSSRYYYFSIALSKYKEIIGSDKE